MKIQEKFSVLMAVYAKDDPNLFRRAIESVYQNTIQPSEFVLVQDGPLSDSLMDLISSYSCSKLNFKLVTLNSNKGLAIALNEGIKHVTSPYIMRADADDYNLPERFEKQMEILLQGFDLVGSAIIELDCFSFPVAIRSVPLGADAIRMSIKYRSPFNHMSVAFRRDFVVDCGGYPLIYLKEDYALWSKMISEGAKVCNLKEVLVHASAGINMYKRRGGFKYILSEIALQKFLIRLNLQSIGLGIVIGFFRSFIFLIPAQLRGIFYESFLRKSIKEYSE
ncbi:glycosyltransferase [Candidatus Methylopumilus universalis]|uniref:glycosyltransferase n=1 Tax=Candidatus Methylopumilus universalis TaxID=2588536 RepID=UPI00111CF17C|nr:glycosyltransferase [Candidatus Methylopumilus universalis]QDC79070.1 glycosyltransferase [Candidatus Methylopumilus universalis]